MYQFLSLFLLVPVFAISQGNYAGTYSGQNFEKDSQLKIISQVNHKLILEKDSSFTYSKINSTNHCNSIYAGYWETKNREIVLNFIDEDPQFLFVNEKAGFCTLESRSEQLSLTKQGHRLYESEKTTTKANNLKKKSKEPPCPTFKKR
ncbi:MAG: hypothetical protein H0V01_01295 [Bacteroidetes bacterium]|nr:hypothetical protein [Bacteroidota bacterium]HET6243175.1 hypothetical protein [Bacteroidia bacterium]